MLQIIPIKELKNTALISDKCHASDEPIYITKNGYGDMVIMSMKTYEEKLQNVDIYDTLALSENEIKEGKIEDAEQFLGKLRNEYGI